MKRALLLLIALGLSPLLEARSYPQIEYVRGRYVDENVFKRVSEYFDEEENQGGKIILRTDPSVREGFYLILSLDDDASDYPAGTRIGVKYIRPDQKGEIVKATTLPTPIPDAEEIWIGLTGDDTPANQDPIVAWMVVIYSPKGEVFAHHKSYLWEKPDDEEQD